MLTFATDFPLASSTTADSFLGAVRTWLLGSPHTVFTNQDTAGFGERQEWSAQKGEEKIEVVKVATGTSTSAAIQHTKQEGGLEWVSRVVFSNLERRPWIGIRTSCESQHPSARLPLGKKPFFVRTLLDNLGGGADGDISVSAEPYRLANSEVPLALRCILGSAGSRLPIVYVSANFGGGHSVRPNVLADALSGMAHVLVEPNRQFSTRLMMEAESENVYGGAVGIYWPDGGGRQSFFPGRQYPSAKELQTAIFEEVRTALINRRPLARTTWPNVQEALSRAKLDELRASGSTAVQEYIENFDAESTARKQELADAEREIERLRSEVRRFQARAPMQAGLTLKTIPEQDLYAGEILAIVRDALQDATTRVVADSRRQHVLKALLDANPASDKAAEMRETLKTVLRDYQSMTAKVKSALQELGFQVDQSGKHIKTVFQGDDRYTFTMASTGSDHRGGLNNASDISRLLF